MDGARDAIRLAREGDLEALAALLERCGPRVRARLSGRLPARHRAVLDEEDVLQVTYLEACLRIGSFGGDSEAAFGAWLAAIAEHNLQDALRELGRAKRPDSRGRVQAAHRTDGDPAADLFEELCATTTSPSRAAARAEARGLLETALARLPRDYAEVVRLYDLEGRAIEETAGRLGRSHGAVHMLRQRAHDRLREALGDPARFHSQATRGT